MLSLAMIRVEPGSTPGIGNTIYEISFLAFSSFAGEVFCFLLFRLCAMFVAFLQGENWSHVILAVAVLEGFYDLPYYRYLVLGTTYYYIKSDNVDEDGTWTHWRYIPHLSALLATATYLTIGMTEPTLPGRYTCMSSSRIAVQCSTGYR